jgi:hypothetical protein
MRYAHAQPYSTTTPSPKTQFRSRWREVIGCCDKPTHQTRERDRPVLGRASSQCTIRPAEPRSAGFLAADGFDKVDLNRRAETSVCSRASALSGVTVSAARYNGACTHARGDGGKCASRCDGGSASSGGTSEGQRRLETVLGRWLRSTRRRRQAGNEAARRRRQRNCRHSTVAPKGLRRGLGLDKPGLAIAVGCLWPLDSRLGVAPAPG